jgi:hypothetical protein
MLEALILICSINFAPECDAAHAIFSGMAPGVFDTKETCQRGAIEYLHTVDFSNVFEPDHDYKVTVSCRDRSQ